MALKAGNVSDFDSSMAQAIENAMRQEWPKVMGEGQTIESNPQLKLLCVAVAQGVIRYLSDNPGAFKVSVDIGADTGRHKPGAVTEIETAGELY